MTLRERYEAGATVEELSLDEGCSTATIRKHLREQGTVMRSPNRKMNPYRSPAHTVDGIKGKKEDTQFRGQPAAQGGKRLGKRRRGKP